MGFMLFKCERSCTMIEEKLRRLMDRLDMEVIHKNGKGWLVSECPFAPWLHEFGSDTNPSFNIHTNPRGYSGFNCFTCHQKGNLTEFMEKLGSFNGEDYSKLIIRAMLDETPGELDDWDALKSEWVEDDGEMDPLDAELYLRMYPSAWDDKAARKYLVRRKITGEAVHALDLRFDPETRRILFPVYDYERKLYGFTGRTILPPPYDRARPKVRDYAGLKKDRCLLGGHLIDVDDEKPFLIVEGLFALASVISRGCLEWCVPLATMGSYMSAYHADLITEHQRSTYLLYDDDLPGDEGLFGTYNPTGDSFSGGGAVDKLKDEVPTFLCLYPPDKDDPDNLTNHEIRMFFTDEGREYQ